MLEGSSVKGRHTCQNCPSTPNPQKSSLNTSQPSEAIVSPAPDVPSLNCKSSCRARKPPAKDWPLQMEPETPGRKKEGSRACPYLIGIVGAGHQQEKPREGVLSGIGDLPGLGPWQQDGKGK